MNDISDYSWSIAQHCRFGVSKAANNVELVSHQRPYSTMYNSEPSLRSLLLHTRLLLSGAAEGRSVWGGSQVPTNFITNVI